MLNIGFTGTRQGMSYSQIFVVATLLDRLAYDDRLTYQVHHGGCVGSDEQFHYLAIDRGIPVVVHPPVKRDFEAELEQRRDVTFLERKSYLERDRDIVNFSDYLFVARLEGQTKGGTVYTHNYARHRMKKIIILNNDKSYTLDGDWQFPRTVGIP